MQLFGVIWLAPRATAVFEVEVMRVWDGLLLAPVLFCAFGQAASIAAGLPDLLVWPAVGATSLAALVVWWSTNRRRSR